MPDLFSVIERQWKWMLTLTLLATVGALIVSLLSPKKYLSVATALPSNAALSDKARIFNQNIEALYPEFGSPDELDKIEGTAKLDTIFLAAAKEFNLPGHYQVRGENANYKAADMLMKNVRINRSGYGELKIKVWDKDRELAATLANALMQRLNDIHQQLRTANSLSILQRLKQAYSEKAQALSEAAKTGVPSKNKSPELSGTVTLTDSAGQKVNKPGLGTKIILQAQLEQYATLINEYDLAVKTTPKPLLVVEAARPSPEPDKPRVLQIVLFTFFASLLFSFLLVVFAESRRKNA